MRTLWRWLVAGIVLFIGRRRRGGADCREEPPPALLPPFLASSRAERAAAALLLLASLGSIAFVVLYFVEPDTQLLGLALGGALAAIAGALILAGKELVPQEKAVEQRPPLVHEIEQQEVAQLVEEGDKGITRRRLLFAAAGAAGATLAAAVVVPAASLGPVLGTDLLYRTPWRAGSRLVGEDGRPIASDDVVEGSFLTAFPEGSERGDLGSPLILIRLPTAQLRLPEGRGDWAPEGILAFSKICTHAGCAVSMYRYPLYAPHAPGPALVCPCHYSTFDPAAGGDVLFGPAGRPLPQLPLRIDDEGNLRAAGDFSGPVGPSWWGVRLREPS
jgi:ubiquinol-cytochrome c reductase iron-sulfur subunit